MQSALPAFTSIIHATVRSRKSTKVPSSGFGRMNNMRNGQDQASPALYMFKESLAAEKALLQSISKITSWKENRMRTQLL